MKVVAEPHQIDTTYSETMSERLNTMKRGCRKHGLDRPGNDRLHKLYPWEYLINREQKLVWCNIFKSGSTSWMYLFNRMAVYSDKKLAQEKRLKRVPMLQLARDELKVACRQCKKFRNFGRRTCKQTKQVDQNRACIRRERPSKFRPSSYGAPFSFQI